MIKEKEMKFIFIGILIFTMAVFSSSKLYAAEDHTLENVFKNAYYGAAIGGLLGAAIMVFTDRPVDHLNYIAYGVAGGVIAGTVYGMTVQARSFADINQGKLAINLPEPEIKNYSLLDPAEKKRTIVSLPLLRYHF